MKLLIFSDLHEEEQALEKIKAFAKREKPDVVLSCGDMARSVSFAEEVINAFQPFYFVPGNWDSKKVNDYYSAQKGYLHKKQVGIGEFNIIGFGFSLITPFHTLGEKTEKEFENEMGTLPINRNTILLLHEPPNGFFDMVNNENIGSTSILKIIDEKKPFMAAFGHVHEMMGVCKRNDTFLVKVPPAKQHRCASVSINNKKPSVEFIHL